MFLLPQKHHYTQHKNNGNSSVTAVHYLLPTGQFILDGNAGGNTLHGIAVGYHVQHIVCCFAHGGLCGCGFAVGQGAICKCVQHQIVAGTQTLVRIHVGRTAEIVRNDSAVETPFVAQNLGH